MWLINCTSFGNSIPGFPSGNTIYQSGNKPSLIVNCTIAGRVGYSPGGPQPLGSMTLRNTIAYAAAGDTNSSNNLISSNPGLGPLADNGGPTLTMALLPDSPAINAANAAYAPATDQRGFVRPYGAGHDIGAFETVFIGSNAGVMRLTSSTYDVLQTNGSATITVYRDHGATGTVSVQFATSDATAIAGQDYTATNGTLTFASGELSKSFVVPINTQPAALTTKTVNLTLSNPTGGATLRSPSVGSLNILPTARLITSNDENALRSAMAGGGVLLLAFDGTMTLTSPLVASATVVLDASGHDVTISGAKLTRLFNVQPGVSLSLNNLTLADGLAQGTNGAIDMIGGAGQGGAVYNENGIFSASNCVLLRNVAAGGTGGAGSDPFFPRPGKGGTGSGAAIYNQNGQVSLTHCNLNDNRAIGGTGGGFSQLGTSAGGDSAGGAIYSTGGTVLIMNCLVNSNRSVSGRGVRGGAPGVSGLASGGGIELGGGQMMLLASVLVGNLSQTEYSAGAPSARGGAMTQIGGSFAARDCVFRENSVTGGYGLGIASPIGQPGGLALGGAFCLSLGVANITNSTFASNLAEGGGQPSGNSPGAGAGGGVYNLGNLQLVNCTLSGNAAKAGSNGPTGVQGGAYGGGLYNYGGTVGLMNTTIANNAAVPSATNASISAIAQGGGIYSVSGAVNLLSSIVANNYSGSNAFGTLVDSGYNLSSDSSCNFTNTGSLNNADPVLGPLDDYGGLTPTVPLLSGSPAINGGDPLSTPLTDQRGRARPYGSASDIGAYESSPSYVIRGRVSGFTLADEVIVSAGAAITITTNRGVYSLEPMATGNHAVTPASADYLFVPNTHLVTVGPDQLGVNFTAYYWNALSLDDVASNEMQLRYAGTNGHIVRLLTSSNLFDWSAVSTNAMGSSNLIEFRVPVSLETPRQFYRAVQD